MALKVYQKRGNLNYKERKLIAEIEEAIAKKYGNDPSIADRFVPAKDLEQLKELHNRYCIEDTTFEEVKDSDISKKGGNDDKDLIDDMDDYSDGDDTFVDPMNREEPIVRDYVMDENPASSNTPINEGPPRTSFDEPASFDEAFEFPGQNIGDNNDKFSKDKVDGKTPSGDNQTQPRRHSTGNNNSHKAEPLNPNFNDMSNKKQKKSTQRFAKYIVETVCLLAEKGFVWYANKDINESKLAEYEVSGEIDLSIMVTLENGQEATIKQFFSLQCVKAEELSVIDKEEKEDLIDALAEVLLEKGVAPTPTQELMMIGLKILGGQAVKLIALKSQTSDLLSQLRAMKSGDEVAGEYVENERRTYQEPARQEPARQEPVKQQPVRKETVVVEPEIEYANEEFASATEDDDEQYLLGQTIETKE